MKLDLRQFNRALLLRASSVKRNAAAELNKALKTVGTKTAKRIPPVPKSEIRNDLTSDPHILAALTSKRLRKRGIGILPPPMFGRAMNRFLAFKLGSSGYMRSPWQQIGGSQAKGFVGVKVSTSPATPRKLRASASFTMKQENNTRYRTAKQRFARELQPVLDSVMSGIDARQVLKGWKG